MHEYDIISRLSELPFSLWTILVEAAPWLLAGYILASFINLFINKQVIQTWLGDTRLRSVVFAALIGVPLPLCSCGVLPTGVGLRKAGVNRGATMAFLISTPESGIDSILYSYAVLGPFMAIMRPIAAFITALIAGVTENIFDKKWNTVRTDTTHSSNAYSCHTHTPKTEVIQQTVSSCCSTAAASSHTTADTAAAQKQTRTLRGVFDFFFHTLMKEMALWIIIGLLCAALISVLIDEQWLIGLNVPDWTVMIIMLAVGIPMYICATGSTPIAAALIAKGISPGAALVFLLAGPATNIASYFILQKYLGKTGMIIYYAAIALCSVGLGIVTDILYASLVAVHFPSWVVPREILQMHSHMPTLFEHILAGVFSVLLLLGFAHDVLGLQLIKPLQPSHE